MKTNSPTTQEKWMPIDGYNGKYDVSNMGNVRSWTLGNRRYREKTPHLLTLNTDTLGRKTVALYKNSKEKRHRVPRLILSAFVCVCPKGMEACHNNGNASYNRLSNIRWDTHKNNCFDRKQHGTERCCFKKGDSGYAKISKDDVLRIREIGRTQSLKNIAEQYPIGSSQISNILLRYSWKNI